MTEIEAQKLVSVLVASFPSQMTRFDAEQIKTTMASYRRFMLDLDYAAANAAVERLIATSRFLPTVAEIREATLALVVGEKRDGGEGWGDVLGAVSRWGRYRTPGIDFQFADPVTHECVRLMGWVNICDSENQVADRARFIELYAQLAAKDRREMLTGGLPAIRRLREAQGEPAKLPSGTVTVRDAMRKVFELIPGGDE